MFASTKIFVATLLISSGLLLAMNDSSYGQAVVITSAPTGYVTVRRPVLPFRRYPVAVPVQATYSAYYAPQVPMVPMLAGPVPIVSAYYVPTIPVTQQYYAPVVPVRRLRHYAVPVTPIVLHPIYPIVY